MSPRPIAAAEFVARLTKETPDAGRVVAEHLADQDGELLLHLLVADLGRYALTAFAAGDTTAANSVLAVMDSGLTDGDEQVANAVAVSFVENIGPWIPTVRPFVATWPDALRAEAAYWVDNQSPG